MGFNCSCELGDSLELLVVLNFGTELLNNQIELSDLGLK